MVGANKGQHCLEAGSEQMRKGCRVMESHQSKAGCGHFPCVLLGRWAWSEKKLDRKAGCTESLRYGRAGAQQEASGRMSCKWAF